MTDEQRKDGGPAFPVTGEPSRFGEFLGMSLRDYFAAKAMHAAITGATGIGSLPDDQRNAAWFAVSTLSYEIADGMLQARNV